MVRSALTIAVILATVPSCTSILLDDPRVVLRTDAIRYAARQVGTIHDSPAYELEVIVRFENHTARPLYLDTCEPNSTQPISLVEFADSSSRGHDWTRAWACTGHDTHLSVQSGGIRIDTLTLRAPTGFNGVTHKPSYGVLEGRFRIHYLANPCTGWTNDCPRSTTVRSNAFDIRVRG